jgi:hypothetical protein
MRKHVPALALSFLLIALVSGVSPALAEGGNSPRDTPVGAIQIKDPSRGEYEKVGLSAREAIRASIATRLRIATDYGPFVARALARAAIRHPKPESSAR